MRSTITASLLVILLFSGSLGLGLLTGQAAAGRAKDPYAKLGVFARVFTIIEHSYVEDIDEDELVDAAIQGMVDHLDTHTRWLDEDEYRSLQEETEGRYEGIGIEVRSHDLGGLILRVLPGGPAARDGLKANDVITAVNGDSLKGLDLNAISEHLQGKRGTEVMLTILRDDTTMTVRSIRDRIDVASTQRTALPGGIAYVRLISFQSDCADDVSNAIRALRAEGADKGVILDLRDNPGGLLSEAVKLVDLFVDEGTIVSTRGRLEGENVHEASQGGFGPDLPVIVLVNGMSASASEVVTGALQDTKRATIIGTHTYGKGSVQTLFGVPDTQEGLKLTIARYHTPSGEPVAAKKGRVPDRVVPFAAAASDALTELREALRTSDSLQEQDRARMLVLTESLTAATPAEIDIPWGEPMADRYRADPQVMAALHELGVPD